MQPLSNHCERQKPGYEYLSSNALSNLNSKLPIRKPYTLTFAFEGKHFEKLLEADPLSVKVSSSSICCRQASVEVRVYRLWVWVFRFKGAM